MQNPREGELIFAVLEKRTDDQWTSLSRIVAIPEVDLRRADVGMAGKLPDFVHRCRSASLQAMYAAAAFALVAAQGRAAEIATEGAY